MASTTVERSSLVVTGSSAGGIEALSVLLGALPADFPAPIVVAQHLDPRVPSSLAAILAKHTQLHVIAVNDTARLEPATVYVVPSDRNVEIEDASVRVLDDPQARPKPSIDRLFASAADAFGERLIAVVLTGMGSDGSTGARAVKLHGGTVMIEDPSTASFPSMPGSLEPVMVDIVAPLKRIATELVRLLAESIELPDDSPALATLLECVRATTGIDFSHYKMATIKRRLARQITLTGHKNITDYLAFLQSDPAELGRLAAQFLIQVTEFFRDRELFDTLRDSIVPEIIDEARNRGGRELRVWSAGCATGEEAYSLAILIAEVFRERGQLPNVRIFATDIDEAAISFARLGVYPAQSIQTIDPALVERYFIETESGWQVAKRIRNITVFGQHDLGQRAPFPRIDLALCRNVLIYFSKELQQRTLQIFAFSLRSGGYLALGKSEAPSPVAENFAVVNPVLRIFRRYGERVAIPPAQPQSARRDIERTRNRFPAFDSSVRDGRVTINDKLGAFLTTSSIGVILVDRHYDIISINASARAMFDIHGVAVGEDVVHLAPPNTSVQLRGMLDSALRNQQPTAGGEEIAVGEDGPDGVRYLALSCYPEIGDAERDVTGAVILAVDVSEIALSRRESQRAVLTQGHEIGLLRKSELQARERLRSLLEANRELAQVNSELRAQNDSLVINAEETEAGTEEIGTLNEEMQATNEELETLNEEFQATIEELNTTNDEHETRSRELEEQLAARDAERHAAEPRAAALASIVDELPIAVATVDADGTVVVANRIFRELQSGAMESSVHINDDAGATISLTVVLRRAGEGQAFAFTYRSIAADQSLSLYRGRARPLTNATVARSIVELEPAPATSTST